MFAGGQRRRILSHAVCNQVHAFTRCFAGTSGGEAEFGEEDAALRIRPHHRCVWFPSEGMSWFLMPMGAVAQLGSWIEPCFPVCCSCLCRELLEAVINTHLANTGSPHLTSEPHC